MAGNDSHSASPPLVAIAGWLIPGAGYWLLGQRVRAVTICVCIVLLFLTGVCIGGVRVVEVPGYGDHGRQRVVTRERYLDKDGKGILVDRTAEDSGTPPEGALGWVMIIHPLDEIREKPWSIAQILTGPIDVVVSFCSVWASQGPVGSTVAHGARSHGRTAELGVLYTAVAGMLNLLAMIDATYRAVESSGEEKS